MTIAFVNVYDIALCDNWRSIRGNVVSKTTCFEIYDTETAFEGNRDGKNKVSKRPLCNHSLRKILIWP